ATPRLGLAAGAIHLGLQLLLFLPLTFFATLNTARMMDVGFGPVGPLLIKLAAIALGPAVIADMLLFYLLHFDFDTENTLVAFLPYMVFAGVPMALAFKLDLKETGLTVLVSAVPRIAVVLT